MNQHDEELRRQGVQQAEQGTRQIEQGVRVEVNFDRLHQDLRDMRREVKENFERAHERIDEVISQQRETNSQVTTLRIWRAKMEGAVGMARGSWAVIVAVIAALISGTSAAAAWIALLN